MHGQFMGPTMGHNAIMLPSASHFAVGPGGSMNMLGFVGPDSGFQGIATTNYSMGDTGSSHTKSHSPHGDTHSPPVPSSPLPIFNSGKKQAQEFGSFSSTDASASTPFHGLEYTFNPSEGDNSFTFGRI